MLDLYDAISGLWPEINSIFSFESISIVHSQALSSLIKLGDTIRTMLSDFESAIQKDSSKSLVPGGGLHPLTQYVMNFLSFLTDYSVILSDILVDWRFPENSSLPESDFESPNPSLFNSLFLNSLLPLASLLWRTSMSSLKKNQHVFPGEPERHVQRPNRYTRERERKIWNYNCEVSGISLDGWVHGFYGIGQVKGIKPEYVGVTSLMSCQSHRSAVQRRIIRRKDYIGSNLAHMGELFGVLKNSGKCLDCRSTETLSSFSK